MYHSNMHTHTHTHTHITCTFLPTVPYYVWHSCTLLSQAMQVTYTPVPVMNDVRHNTFQWSLCSVYLCSFFKHFLTFNLKHCPQCSWTEAVNCSLFLLFCYYTCSPSFHIASPTQWRVTVFFFSKLQRVVTNRLLHATFSLSMYHSNKECPTCRKKLVSKRSLRADPNFDALIAKVKPSQQCFRIFIFVTASRILPLVA